MALIIEDGTIVESADAYVDADYATQYHADRNNTDWANADSTQQDAAIRVATQYLDGKYHDRWKGSLVESLQPRQWPRQGVNISGVRGSARESFDGGSIQGSLPSNLIPVQLKQATCELALRALSGPLAADMARGGLVASKTVGPITTTFMPTAPGATSYPVVDQLLAPFISSSNSCEMVRG